MADTPLHEHEAVKHLMGTEHWPKREYREARVRLVYRDGEYPPYWAWQYEIDGNTRPEYHPAFNAEGDITLAAVRGINNNGDVHSFNFGPCNDPAKGEFYATVYDAWGRVSHYYAPTEPLAVLEAYRATVMGNNNAQ